MQCLLPLFLWFLPAAYATVTLNIGSTASVGVPTNVSWTRAEGDPTTFDLRFVTEDGTDVGFAVTIVAQDDQLSGSTPVTFPVQGQIVLKAIDFNSNNDQDIAGSSPVSVSLSSTVSSSSVSSTALSTVTPSTTTTTITTTTLVPSSTTSPSASTSTTTGTSQKPTTLAPPSTTSNPSSASTSTTTGTSQKPSRASSTNSLRTAAIVGGVLGSLILIVVLLIIFILVKRRREQAKTKRRLTFHRDLMVQRRQIAPDLENGQGAGIDTNPTLPPLSFQAPVTVPTPQRPMRPQFPASPLNLPVEHPPTHRQIELGSRIVQIEQQMTNIRRQNRGQAGIEPVLEQMKRQVEWLRAERDSRWARCETDERPPLLDYYMD